ncbi:hypothetical protein AC578_1525 [Pseudocercospora eumusae]|uniref:Uncharacterized protein n=1 Tax=Pseudocercospora eumusae TaxID=321146 RepID=A0A139GXY4_9PEZI|nr:hypothetical protein AC578_1525 [Pseudocercospora eumusae]
MDPATTDFDYSDAVQNFAGPLRHDTYPAIATRDVDMTGKTILVTGASSGCGKAIVRSFAKCGASRIALLARRDMSSLIEEISALAQSSGRPKPHVLALRVDHTVQSQVEEGAKKFSLEFGPSLDVLVNNAASMDPWLPITDSHPDTWWRTWEVNVKGPYLVARSFIPFLLRSPTKTLVQISSMAALLTRPGGSAYQGTKSALLRLSNHLRLEYADQGLLIHNLHPGAVRTELALTMPARFHEILVDAPELCGDVVVWLVRERRGWLQDRFVSAQWDVTSLEAQKERIVAGDLLRLRLVTG